MQCIPQGLQSKNVLTDPFLTLVLIAALSLTAASLQELANDLSYSKFLELVKSPQSSTINSIEARPGVRDILGGHTLFVQIEPQRAWKSVFVRNDKLNEISRAIRKQNLEICFVCGTSIQLFKVLPSLLLLLFSLGLIRIGKLLALG